jgi:hypothetical protein
MKTFSIFTFLFYFFNNIYFLKKTTCIFHNIINSIDDNILLIMIMYA